MPLPYLLAPQPTQPNPHRHGDEIKAAAGHVGDERVCHQVDTPRAADLQLAPDGCDDNVGTGAPEHVDYNDGLCVG